MPWGEIAEWARAIVAIIVLAIAIYWMVRTESNNAEEKLVEEEDQDSDFTTVATAAKR